MLQNGSRLMDIGLPEKTLAIMVKRDSGYFIPTGKTILKENDHLLVITDNTEILVDTWQTDVTDDETN
jgi:cell volume regulation protein A